MFCVPIHSETMETIEKRDPNLKEMVNLDLSFPNHPNLWLLYCTNIFFWKEDPLAPSEGSAQRRTDVRVSPHSGPEALERLWTTRRFDDDGNGKWPSHAQSK